MKRIGIITLVFALCISCLVSCSSDSDVLRDKEILLETITRGSWQVSFQHSLTKQALEHPTVQLAFEDGSLVNALKAEGFTGNGSYRLLYDGAAVPNYDDPEYDYLDREKDRDEDLFLSLAFAMKELIILNQRWQVRSFTSDEVKLRSDDLMLTLSRAD